MSDGFKLKVSLQRRSTPQINPRLRDMFHGIHNVVDGGVLLAMWRNLRAKLDKTLYKA